MTHPLRLNRRRFLTLTAATAGGIMMPGTGDMQAASVVHAAEAGETAHFWYRLQPPGIYLDSQRDNKAFGYGQGMICLSEDNSRTWPHSLEFPDARNITFSRILKNGNIVFATGSRLYFSTDNLRSYNLTTVKDGKWDTAQNDSHPHAVPPSAG